MAWRRIGDKPLSEPKVTQFNDAYMRHPASMCELNQPPESTFQRLFLKCNTICKQILCHDINKWDHNASFTWTYSMLFHFIQQGVA